MKRLITVSVIILVCLMFGIIFITEKSENTDITQEATKVGFILSGRKDDKSWGQAHFEGMQKSSKELNLEVTYKEEVPQNETCEKVMEELIKNGCEIIICNSYGFGEYELDMAMKYPDVTFFHTSGTKDADNLSTYFGRMYQIRYLCGIVAGLQTETNEIGYVAAYDLSEVNRGINAFTLGVRKVNPDANVYVRYCDSWDNDDATKKVAQELFDSHNIDVMTVHSDSLAAYDEAEKRGIYIIGYNRDDSEDYPDYYLTAAIWQWDKFYTPKIKEVLQDKFKKEQYWDGVESGIVELAPLTKNVKDGTERIVTSELFKLENGNFDVFYGPIYDTDGNLRVAEGESMTDEVMLNSFDWNVEGVVIDEK